MLLIVLALFFSEPTLYDRVDARLALNPKLLERPATVDDVQWMIGRWSVTAHVFKGNRVSKGEQVVEPALGGGWLTMRDHYPDGGVDVGYLTRNTITKQWISLAIDSLGNAVKATGKGWEGNKLVLTSENAEIIGERVRLRQTITKRSADEYHVLNEERLPSGRWVALDEYTYHALK